MLSKPTFLLDILYVHHRSSEPSVLCQEIFDILCELQHEEPAGSSRCGKTAYVMESHSSPLKFLPAVAAMLSHPVQRGELYGDGGLLERLDPSEAFIAEIRERVLAASVAVTPDHRASSTASNSKVHESRNNQGSSSAKNIANSSNISNNSSSGSGDTFSNKVKHSAWSLFSGKK